MRALRRLVPVVALLVTVVGPAPPAAAATIMVTKTADTADGSCDADCSLREAVILANTSAEADVIQIPAGHYRLTLTGTPEDSSVSGDLDVTKTTTFLGAGTGATIIDAGEQTGLNQRVFEISAFNGISAFDVTFSGLTITGGYMDTMFTGIGGGILVRPGVNLTLVDAAVIDNYVSFSGAGIQVEPGSTLSMVRTTVAENWTTFTGFGAGIMAGGDSATIVDSTIAQNSSITDGAGIAAINTTLTVRNTTISGNRADGHAGGLYSSTSSVDLRNVTLTNNTADNDQTGGGDGGGIYHFNGTTTLRNTIVAGNRDSSPTGPPTPDCAGNLTSAGHNLLGRNDGCTFAPTTGDQVGTSASPIDPFLGPLADNGGTTETHALAHTSPAADAGGADCGPADQRGAPRTGACDIGAYELVTCKNAVVNRIGTEGDDTLVGTSGPDGFLAFGGNDIVRGLGGKDTACLGPGKDVGAGGGGKDRLFGEGGKDRLRGQGGNDRLVGGPGTDTCVGGPGKKDRARQCEVKKSVP